MPPLMNIVGRKSENHARKNGDGPLLRKKTVYTTDYITYTIDIAYAIVCMGSLPKFNEYAAMFGSTSSSATCKECVIWRLHYL